MAHRWRTKQPTAADAARRREYASAEYRKAGPPAEKWVRTGTAYCWRCRGRIPATAKRGPDWQLGHDDHDRRIIQGPEHTTCNRKAAARAGNRAQRAKRRGTRTGTERAVKRRALLG